MKILIIHNIYRTDTIGGEDIVYRNELSSLRAALGKENVFNYEVSNDEINKLSLLFSIWFSRKHYLNIQTIIKRHNIDLVHVHNFYPLLTPSIFKAAKDCGVTVVHTLHNYRLWCISGIFYRDNYGICEICAKRRSLKGILNRCYRKSLLQSALTQAAFWYYNYKKAFDYVDYFFVLTKFQRDKIRELGINNKRIILKPNSLDLDIESDNDKSGYIYVGRLEESKGIEILLNVWKTLDQKFTLTIVGGGANEDRLKQEFKQKNIIFKGFCSRDTTLKYISKSRYLIHPSLWYETFGLNIIEAMSYGTPVIGFNIGTRNNFILHKKNGFLTNKENLKESLITSYNYASYEKLSKNAVISSMDYNNKDITKKQIDTYKSCLKKHPIT